MVCISPLYPDAERFLLVLLGLHAVHHLNAQVPFHRLRDAHTELMTENKAFREKNVIAHGLWDTFMQIYQRPTLVREPVVAQKSGQM
jgi:fatty acid desaturase